MMSRSSDLVRFTLMAKLSSTKKTAILPLRAARALLQAQHFVDDALVGAKADGIAEETGHGAELAAVRTAAAGFDGDDVKRLPTHAEVLHDAAEEAGDAVELVEIEGFPRNPRVVLEARLPLLAECVHGRVDFFQSPGGGVGDDPRPGLVGFAQRDRVGMARPAIAAQGFVRALR